MLQIHVGHSQLPDSEDAARDAINQCKQALGDDNASAALLFLSSDHQGAPILAAVRQAFPGIELAGCTTSGEVTSAEGFCEGSVVLTIFSTDNIDIRAGVGLNASANPEKAAAEAAIMALEGTKLQPQFCLTFPDGLTSNCTGVIEGLKSVLGSNFPVFGGAAADDWKFEQTFQFCGDETLSDSVPVLLFCGDIDFAFGCSHGWTPFTKRAEVTHAEGNVVYSFDGRPALEMYRHYVGTDASALAEYPLAVFTDRDSDNFYLRAGMGYDTDKGSITFAGDVPQSSWVQISKTSRDDMIAACEQSLSTAVEGFSKTPQAALIFSCAARKEQLGTHTELESAAMGKRLSVDIPAAGFYCYAEISPLVSNEPTYVHNETFITLLLSA